MLVTRHTCLIHLNTRHTFWDLSLWTEIEIFQRKENGFGTSLVSNHFIRALLPSTLWEKTTPTTWFLEASYLCRMPKKLSYTYEDVSKNRGGPPKSSILIGFSIISTIHFEVARWRTFKIYKTTLARWWFQWFFWFSPLPGEMIHFD